MRGLPPRIGSPEIIVLAAGGARRPRDHDAHGHAGLHAVLDTATGLLDAHLAAAVQRYGSAALDVVDLPALEDEGPQLGVGAVVLWLYEVEQAGLPGFVETLAEHAAHGWSPITALEDASELAAYHRRRTYRFGREERAEMYRHILGDPDSTTAPGSMTADGHDIVRCAVDRLADAILATLDVPPTIAQARLDVSAGQLRAVVAPRVVGLASYFARDAVQHVRETLELLQRGALATALGAGSVWAKIRRHARVVLDRDLDPTPYLTLADAGRTLLEWAGRPDFSAIPHAAAQRWREQRGISR